MEYKLKMSNNGRKVSEERERERERERESTVP
jgi:hypothetical protein